jgi:molybdenum cofactor cytidylyltransferase
LTVGAIVLAAGSARRMGADKLGADLGGRPMIDHVLTAIAAAGLPAPIVAVPPGGLAGIGGGVRRVEVLDHQLGMGHSLAAAARAIPDDWRAVIVALGDMPFVRIETLRALADAAAEAMIVAPSHDGRRGNPVAWGRDFFAALGGLSGDRGGRALIDAHAAQLRILPVDDPGILIDVDTPEALAAARERFRAS